jgi:hypothetical protein
VPAGFLPHDVEKSILLLLEDLSTPRALTVSLLWRYGEWDQLATLPLVPEHYLDAESYWRDASATCLVKKLEDLPTSFDRKAVAEENFIVSEQQCFRTNQRLYPYVEDRFSNLSPTDGVHGYFNRVRKIVAAILGPCPDLVEGRFGPGSTFGDRGVYVTVPDKMSSSPTLTSDAWPFLVPWSGTLWAKACTASDKIPEFIRGNRFLTVPKDSTKFRGIAVEPSINVFYQLAYGRVIRDKLSRFGLSLVDGQDHHKRLACEASSKGDLVTLDLKNASDTVSRNLVRLLLPQRWYEVLDSLRSKRTLFKGNWRLLEKFSSMGNGFTFELETLIFYCLILGLCEDLPSRDVITVFGDDIIIPAEMSKDVTSMLSFCGFTVNMEKSCLSGPFRESCGGDFFLGVGVRPLYLKESPNEPQQIIAYANGLRRAANNSIGRDYLVHRAWLSALGGLPTKIRNLRGPSGLGDLVIHDESERWRTRWRHGVRYVQVYRPARYRKVSWRGFNPAVTLAAAVYGVPWNNGEIIPRNSVSGYKIGWTPFS